MIKFNYNRMIRFPINKIMLYIYILFRLKCFIYFSNLIIKILHYSIEFLLHYHKRMKYKNQLDELRFMMIWHGIY